MGDQLAVGFEDILAEARKYGLVLTVANQYVDQLTLPVRAAIFGNVATLITFRVGVKDARLVADEFGAYSSDELMGLEMGQAICRVGGSQTAFNLATPPPPKPNDPEFSDIIRARARRCYAKPREQVAAQFETAAVSATPGSEGAASAAKPAKHGNAKSEGRQTPRDPWDIWSDFVS